MRKYEFGEFELDLDAVQLRHRGQPVRLERRPLDLLILLVERHGQLVSRDDIIAALWPERVIIDFESGLNTLVRKVRNALGDASDEPRFIETVPGRGYRFIAQVRPVTVAESPQTTNSRRRAAHPVTAVVVVLLLAAGVVGIGRYFMAEPEQIRIAILPFDNLTGDANLGYIASGLAEETNTSLAQIDLPNLSVIGVVSTTAVAGSDLPLSAIGRQLGADFVVKSSLRLERSRIRVTSRLLRVDDGEQLWSASFDRELTNLLGLQRELSIAIAEQVRQTLSPDIAAAIDRRQTQNPEAYSLYLRGRHAWMQFQPDSVPRALNYYRQAVELDPTYALAWAGLAHTLITSTATIDASRNSVLSTAYEALQKALDYGPDLAESQLALGSFYLFLESDVVAAEAAARRAIALDPNSAMSHMFLGITLAQADNPLEARAMMRRARELDPLFPLMFANSAIVSLDSGEPEEALEFATQAIAINPQFWVGYLHQGGAHLQLGNYGAALQAYTQAEKLSGYNAVRPAAGRAYVLAVMGREDEARDILAELEALSARRNIPHYLLATIHVGLGEIDKAFELLEQGVAANEVFCLDLVRSRHLAALQDDLRFEPLLERCLESRRAGTVE